MNFNPRGPLGPRQTGLRSVATVSAISIHAVLWDRDGTFFKRRERFAISIHAVLWDRDIYSDKERPDLEISIHAVLWVNITVRRSRRSAAR